jgi:phage protein D
MISSMRVRIASDGFPWSDVKLGDEATAAFGGHADMTFTGVVVSVRHFSKAGVDMIEILALDGMIKLAASRMTKFWEDSTDSDIVSAVLGDAGVDAGTVDSTSVSHKYVLQRNESNLAFLKRLAARNGFLLMGNQDGTVDFKKPQFSGTAKELARGDLLSLDYTVSHQEVPPNITVHGWNYIDKEMVEGTASSGDVEAIGGGSDAVSETGSIWQDDMYLTELWVSDQGAAKDMAVAELNRRARSFVRGRGVVHGDGAIRAGTKVKLKEFATGFNPEGFVVGTRHRIQGGTYTTEFFFESNTKPE